MTRGSGAHLRHLLHALVNAVQSAALAPDCVACRLPLEHPLLGPVCPACWASLARLSAPACDRCGASLPTAAAPTGPSAEGVRCSPCERQTHAVDRTRAAHEYEGALRPIIQAYKFESRESLAGPLGMRLRTCAPDLLAGAACAVPVPLHAWRRMTRGFNQAERLARELGLPVVHALWRRRRTAPQSGLHADARHTNVQGAFAVAPWLRQTVRQRYLTGQAVVLVDDVRTTGATLEACAAVLKSLGVQEVRALTVARASASVR